MVREACSKGEETPAGAGEWEPYPRWHLLHDEVVGDLTKEIAAIENSVDLVELGALKVEIFFGAGNVCVVEIRAIEVVHPVHQTDVSHDEKIDFDDQMSLGLGGSRGSPNRDTDLVGYRRHDVAKTAVARFSRETLSRGEEAFESQVPKDSI